MKALLQTVPLKQSAESEFSLLKIAASAVASLTLILVLLGFGVSLAIESKLALPHSSLYESSVELLDLGSVAVIEILPKLFENIGKAGTYLEMIANVWQSLWVVILLYVISVALVFYLKYVKKIDMKARKEKAKAYLAESDKRSFLVRAGLFLLFLLASTLSPMFVYFGLVLAMVLLAIIPMMGWFAGMSYVNEAVINNRDCAPLPSVKYYQAQKAPPDSKKSADSKSLTQTIQCVKVVKDDAEVATGRLVLSTSKTVILYLPDGVARRVPISDAVIEVVDKLPSDDAQASNPKKSQGETTDKTK